MSEGLARIIVEPVELNNARLGDWGSKQGRR